MTQQKGKKMSRASSMDFCVKEHQTAGHDTSGHTHISARPSVCRHNGFVIV